MYVYFANQIPLIRQVEIIVDEDICYKFRKEILKSVFRWFFFFLKEYFTVKSRLHIQRQWTMPEQWNALRCTVTENLWFFSSLDILRIKTIFKDLLGS